MGGSFGAGLQVCVEQDKLPDVRGRRQELHVITKVSRIHKASAVLMMGTNKGVKETHYHYSILKALQEQTCDQVV